MMCETNNNQNETVQNIEIGDGTYITAHNAQTRVRGGGAAGGRAWLARITGTDEQYGLAREFVQKIDNTSGSGKSGSISWHIRGDGVYEYRGFAHSSSKNYDGFVLVQGDHVEEISKARAMEIAEQMEAEQ